MFDETKASSHRRFETSGTLISHALVFQNPFYDFDLRRWHGLKACSDDMVLGERHLRNFVKVPSTPESRDGRYKPHAF